MELDRRSAERDVQLGRERGSATLEGIAGIAIVFILFIVLAQAATALLAHRTAQGVVAASAARLAIAPGGFDAERQRVRTELSALVPGADGVDVDVDVGTRMATVTGRFAFVPPGPLFGGLVMEVTADAPIVVEP